VVVADQNDSGFGDFVADIARGENPLVGVVGLAKVAKIFASGGGIDSADLTLDEGRNLLEISRDRVVVRKGWPPR